MSEIPEVFAIFEQKLAHVLSFNLRQKGQKKAIEELLVYFSGIVERASKAEARIAELEKDNAEFRQLIRDWSIVLEQDDYFQLWHVESVRQAMLEINKEREE